MDRALAEPRQAGIKAEDRSAYVSPLTLAPNLSLT
jgi:hypothetical protein